MLLILAALPFTAPIARGAAAEEYGAALRAARPLALASADVDEDGTADLLAGYASGSGGILVLHRGNVDAIYPNTPAARARQRSGRRTAAPFLPGPRYMALPGAPEFLHTGDFDADGHIDVIAAAPGVGALVLRGDGTGALGRPQVIPLPGTLTAMTVGNLNGLDGLADVAFAVTTSDGPRVLVFAGYDGAWTASAASYDLPAPAGALAIAVVDGQHAGDLVVAAGRELLIIHPPTRASAVPTRAAVPATERHALPFAVRSIASGDFNGDRVIDLAVTSADGSVHILESQRPAVDRAATTAAPAAGLQRALGGRPVAVTAAAGLLVPARLTNGVADDLLALDRTSGQLQLVSMSEPPNPQLLGPAAAVLRMRLDGDARDDLVVLRPGDPSPLVLGNPAATTRIVVNTNDSGPGSLRQAILDANDGPGEDVITFNIPGPAPHTIVPLTPLPDIVITDSETNENPLIIDGTTEPDFAGTPVIELSGAVVGMSGNGLTIASPRCVVRGLVINRFAAGILFTSNVERSRGVQDGVVEGNYIGTDVTGTIDLGNGTGVTLGTGPVSDPVHNIRVGGTAPEARNVISGNDIGLAVNGGLMRILGNFIGTDASGARPLGNTLRGLLMNSSHLTEVGGSAAGARNIISGNLGDGLQIHETGPMLIQNNYVGTDVTGMLPLGNGGDGVSVPDSAGVVAGNVVSGNAGIGIHAGSVFAQLDVLSNRIGTNSAGTTALGNRQGGVRTHGFGYVVRGNVVSGNGGFGVQLLGGTDQMVQNRIGTDITGTLPLGNQGDGIDVQELYMTIGAENGGNVIAFNSGRGIVVPLPSPARLRLLSNSIFANGGLGIDLGGDGVTANDPCDVDGQANAPVLTRVSTTATTTTIAGQLNSVPGTTSLVHFFVSEAADPSGYGEGATLLGSATVTTDGSCTANFSVVLPGEVGSGRFVTATATQSPGADGLPATSEFSNAMQLLPQTSTQAIRALVEEVRHLVERGELKGGPGLVLYFKLRAALFFVERDQPRLAAQQLRGFIQLVEMMVKLRLLDADDGRGLAAGAQAIIVTLRPNR